MTRRSKDAVLAFSGLAAAAGVLLAVLLVLDLTAPRREGLNPRLMVSPSGAVKTIARETEPNHWRIPRSSNDNYLPDPGRVNREIRLKPTMGGTPDAVTEIRIAQIALDSPMYAAGFRQDDRILQINGAPITTLNRAINLVHEVRAASQLTVRIDRGGKIINYRFDFGQE